MMARLYPQLLVCLFTLIFALVGTTAARAIAAENTVQPVTEPELSERSAANAAPPKNAAAITAAVGSTPNTSWFWTGRRGACATEDDGVKTLAGTLASSHGGSTLEQRLATQKVVMPSFGSSPDAKAAWRFASGTYATQASGDVFVVLGKCVRAGNTWETTELPSLQKGGKVKCVFQFTTADNWKDPTFLWAAAGQEATCKGKLTGKTGLFPREF
jgi:hypothetical protein